MWDTLFVVTPLPSHRWHCGGLGKTRVALLLPFLVVALGLRLWCPFRLGMVKGTSMYPSLRNGQVFLFQSDYYRTQPLRRGDVILIRHDHAICVKRVYALGGDHICTLESLDSATLLVDPDRGPRLARAMRRHGRHTDRVVTARVPAHAVWVLGDNFSESRDSRHYGPVPHACILGRVLGVGHLRREPPGVVLRHATGRENRLRM